MRPTLTAATWPVRGVGWLITPALMRVRQATSRAAQAPLMAVVRVPPSAWRDVAVDVDGALAESGAVGYSSEAAAYQALNFGGAASHCRFTLGTGESGAGQHGIFGGNPADASTAQEGRNALVHRCGADDSGHAHLHESRTFGESLVTGLQIQGANLVVGASVSPH